MPNKPRIEVTEISAALADPRNVRRRDDRAKATLGGSLRQFGPARSIVLDKDNVVRAGNGTLEQAAAAGVKKLAIIDADPDTLIAVRRRDWTDADAQAYSIADNRAGDLSTFDYAEVQDQLRELAEGGHAGLVAAAGFQPGEVEALLEAARPKPEREEVVDTSPKLDGMSFRIVVDCDSEEHQVRLLDRFNTEGIKCRALIS